MSVTLDRGGECLLLLDVGGHAAKAEIRDRDGVRLAAARSELAVGERWPEAVLAALESAIARAAGELGDLLPRLGAAGLAVTRADVACWSRMTGEALGPVLGWQDRRGAEWLAKQPLDSGRVAELTGLPLSAHYGAAKLHWCLESLPAVGEALLEGGLAWGPLGSYLINRLTEERSYYVDPTLAQRSLLWDRQSGDWSSELAAAFDIPEFTLPAVVPSVGEFGHLRVLGQRVPLRVVCGDQNAVPYSAGIPRAGEGVLNLGSGAFMLLPQAGPQCGGGWLTSCLPGDDGPAWACEATVNGAANALEWWATESGVAFDASRLAEWLAADAGQCVFLNGVNGLGSPWWQSDFASRFEGRASPAGRGRAVAESIAFLLACNLQRLSEARVESLRVGGGLAASREFVQLLADATGLPMQRIADGEATLDGLFVLLGGRPVARETEQLIPDPSPDLQARQRRWQASMPALN